MGSLGGFWGSLAHHGRPELAMAGQGSPATSNVMPGHHGKFTRAISCGSLKNAAVFGPNSFPSPTCLSMLRLFVRGELGGLGQKIAPRERWAPCLPADWLLHGVALAETAGGRFSGPPLGAAVVPGAVGVPSILRSRGLGVVAYILGRTIVTADSSLCRFGSFVLSLQGCWIPARSLVWALLYCHCCWCDAGSDFEGGGGSILAVPSAARLRGGSQNSKWTKILLGPAFRNPKWTKIRGRSVRNHKCDGKKKQS
jgi:hypothetical protein